MSKSNYEIYAEKKQPELLNKTCTLRHCIACLQENRKIFSEDYMEAQIDLAAPLFGLVTSEIKDAMENKEYWCL